MKCNVANGFCPNHDNTYKVRCLLNVKPNEFIKSCEHRLRMNRLQRVFENRGGHWINKIGTQWEKEKSRGKGLVTKTRGKHEKSDMG